MPASFLMATLSLCLLNRRGKDQPDGPSGQCLVGCVPERQSCDPPAAVIFMHVKAVQDQDRRQGERGETCIELAESCRPAFLKSKEGEASVQPSQQFAGGGIQTGLLP